MAKGKNACNTIFKEHARMKKHTQCCKSRHKGILFFGWNLNAFLGKKTLFEDMTQYQVCHNVSMAIQKKKLVQQSTIRRAHVSLYAVRERRAVHSTTANMRELQRLFQLIVDLGDQASKIEKVKARFVWMGEIADHLKYDHVGMFLRMDDGSLFKVLEVRKSGIEGSGLGLFAACEFSKDEMVTIFVGKEIEKTVVSIFSISNTFVTLDAAPWCAENMDQTYLAAHMANDPNWREEGDDKIREKIEPNVISCSCFELVATKTIKAGDEILLDYKLTTDNN